MACEMCANLCIAADKKAPRKFHVTLPPLPPVKVPPLPQAGQRGKFSCPSYRMTCWQGGDWPQHTTECVERCLHLFGPTDGILSLQVQPRRWGWQNRSLVCCVQGLSHVLFHPRKGYGKWSDSDGTLCHSERLKIKRIKRKQLQVRPTCKLSGVISSTNCGALPT